jgi:hypothetical protein
VRFRSHLWGYSANGALTDSVQERAEFFAKHISKKILGGQVIQRSTK